MGSIAGLTMALAMSCAPDVAPETIARIVAVESNNQVFALNVNKLGGRQPRANNAEDAARWARHYIERGHTVDMGLMQINSANLRRLGYTVEEILDPCTNVRAGAKILTENFNAASRQWDDPQRALQAALSAYNTGNFRNGFRNGYVAKYMNGPSEIELADGDPVVVEAQEEAVVLPVEDIGPPPVTLIYDTAAPVMPDSFHSIGQPSSPHDAGTHVVGNWSRK